MVYQTGTATDLGNLLTQMSTFITANGWTQDEFDNGASVSTEGHAAWHLTASSSIYVSMRWAADAPNNLAIYQALGFTAAIDPGAHTDDSGNGYNATTAYTDSLLDDGRCCNDFGDGPFTYHFFHNLASPAYVHVVTEIATGQWRHFGFGEMEKFNDWTGGDYCYGHFAFESLASTAVRTTTTIFADGLFSATTSVAKRACTITATGLPNQGASEKWLICGGGFTTLDSADRLDTAGEIKRVVFGGARGGPVALGLGNHRSDVSTGHLPMYPFALFLRDYTTSFIYFLGNMPDIRGINIFNFAEAQEITIGTDTWIVFPQAKRTESNVIDRTYYQGFAYKKVIT